MIIPSNLLTPDEEIAMLDRILRASETLTTRVSLAIRERLLTDQEMAYLEEHNTLCRRFLELWDAREAERQQAAAPPALPAPDDQPGLLLSQGGEL